MNSNTTTHSGPLTEIIDANIASYKQSSDSLKRICALILEIFRQRMEENPYPVMTVYDLLSFSSSFSGTRDYAALAITESALRDGLKSLQVHVQLKEYIFEFRLPSIENNKVSEQVYYGIAPASEQSRLQQEAGEQAQESFLKPVAEKWAQLESNQKSITAADSVPTFENLFPNLDGKVLEDIGHTGYLLIASGIAGDVLVPRQQAETLAKEVAYPAVRDYYHNGNDSNLNFSANKVLEQTLSRFASRKTDGNYDISYSNNRDAYNFILTLKKEMERIYGDHLSATIKRGHENEWRTNVYQLVVFLSHHLESSLRVEHEQKEETKQQDVSTIIQRYIQQVSSAENAGNRRWRELVSQKAVARHLHTNHGYTEEDAVNQVEQHCEDVCVPLNVSEDKKFLLLLDHANSFFQQLIFNAENDQKDYALLLIVWGEFQKAYQHQPLFIDTFGHHAFETINPSIERRSGADLLALDKQKFSDWVFARPGTVNANGADDDSEKKGIFQAIRKIIVWIFRDALGGTISMLLGLNSPYRKKTKKTKAVKDTAAAASATESTATPAAAPKRKETLPDLDQEPKKRKLLESLFKQSYLDKNEVDSGEYDSKEIIDLSQKFSLVNLSAQGFYYLSDRGIRTYSKVFKKMQPVAYARKRYNELYDYLVEKGRFDKRLEDKKKLLKYFDDSQRALLRRK